MILIPEEQRDKPGFIIVEPGLEKELRKACELIGGHDLERLLDEMSEDYIILNERAISTIRDYVRRIEIYLHEKYPRYTGEEDSDPCDEDKFLDDSESFRNKIVHKVANTIGDDWLERYT